MLNIQCKHVSTERQKTQTKILFTTNDVIDPLVLINIEKAPGFLLFNSDKVTQERELVIKDKRIGLKENEQSGSKRLRGALYEYWFDNINDMDFDEFYNIKINNIIKMVTDKLE